MASTMIEIITQKCPVCHNQSVLKVDADDYQAYRMGAFVQDAFPSMSPDEREMLITGTHPECWIKLWSHPYMEDESDPDICIECGEAKENAYHNVSAD